MKHFLLGVTILFLFLAVTNCQSPTIQPVLVTNTLTPAISTTTVIQSPTVLPTPLKTPTPISPSFPSSLSSLVVAYTANGGLWSWHNGKAEELSKDTYGSPDFMYNTNQISLTDDGKKIAFTKGDYEVWSINSDGTEEKLLLGPEVFNPQPIEDVADAGGAIIRPYKISWLPGTHTLLVNTLAWIATGLYYPSDDAYKVNTDTGEVLKITSKDGGRHFYPSPDGKLIAVVQPDLISLMDTDGKHLRKVLSFPWISFYYEPYFPDVTWANDSKSFTTAIPSSITQDQSTSTAKLWHVFTDSGHQLLYEFPWLTYPYNLSAISPDFSHFTYLNAIDLNNGMSDVQVVDIATKQSQHVFDGAVNIDPMIPSFKIISWSPDSSQFVLVTAEEKNNVLSIDLQGNTTTLDTAGSHVRQADWVDPFNLLMISENSILINSHGNPSSIKLTDIQNWHPLNVYDYTK